MISSGKALRKNSFIYAYVEDTSNRSIKNIYLNLSLKRKRQCIEKLYEFCEDLNPAIIYLFKFNNSNSRKRCAIYSKLTIKHQDDVNDIVLVFLMLT